MKVILLFTFSIMFTSCANYINKIHNDIDRADGKRFARKRKLNDTFNRFRSNPKNGIDSSTRPNMMPSVKRQYQPKPTKKRYTADDLLDTKNEGSLWAGSGNDNYLFTKNKWKRNGDIVLMNVQTTMKNLISMELKRAFPLMPAKKKAIAKAGAATAASTPAPAPTPEADVQTAGDENIHDKVSSVIIEEISKDHLLIRGQKFLLFRNKKHLVEVQALIARRDIKDDDTVDSNDFLESSVNVLR